MVEILCTLIGVVTGVTIVAALMHHQNARNRVEPKQESLLPDEAEGLKGLTTQLQILTHRVAADVSAHTQKVVHINERLLPAQNEPERILTAINDLIQANESMQGQLEAAQDRLSKQSEQIESTARQARTDALTGLSNRRALEESLKNRIDSVKQSPTTGLMLIDIDHFKSFNDTYGHTTGDAVLASFARSIAKWCDGKFYAARYGGEEFAIILTGETGATLAKMAASARAFISAQVIAYEDLRLSITASAGLTIIEDCDTINRVYERADEGLYRSKKAGRNRGHWLDSGIWKQFPNLDGSEAASSEPAVAESVKNSGPNTGSEKILQTRPALATESSDSSDVLDLAAFVERLESQLKQLSRAAMPAAAIMIEAVGLTRDAVDNFEQAWSEVLEIVKSNLRGIDLVCRLRQNTLCIFMPGCTLNSSIERAGGMQHMLHERQANSEHEGCPERFAIATGSCIPNETAGIFLQRLEDALDEAQDAAQFELVVCEAASTYFCET